MIIGLVVAFIPARWVTPAEWVQFLKEIFELSGENGLTLYADRRLAAAGMILAGMATAYVLFRIEQAFRPQNEAPKKSGE